MTWTITHKQSYTNEFIELPKDLQRSVSNAITELTDDPITPRGDTIKKLSGYENVYRYRIGNFRLVYAADSSALMVQLLAIGPRGSVYKRFNYDGWNAPEAAVSFGPKMAKRDDDWLNHPEWFEIDKPTPNNALLPRPLTGELLTRWRIDPPHHAALIVCRTEDDLLNANAHVPGAVIDRVMKGLYEPDAAELAAEPDLVLFDPEDLIRYAEGDLAGFLLRLDDQQEPLTRWALRGPTLVKGGPGSGKSTVALYRVRTVVEHHLRQHAELPSVFFTTYTNALINTNQSLLRQLLADTGCLTKSGQLPPQIRVNTLAKTAQWIVKDSGDTYKMADERSRDEALRAARAATTPRTFGQAGLLAVHSQVKDLRDDYLLEEFDWVIEGQNCRSLEAYWRADRTGRGLAFTRERRAAVWQLYQAYHDYLAANNYLTWGELTLRALDRVRSGEFDRRWDYVIVDEAQDLTPAALSLAVELCREPSSVFLTADANQSLYNRGFRWRAVHESLAVSGRARILRRNYRTAHPIVSAATEIVAGIDGADAESTEQEFVHDGPRPTLYTALNTTDEWRVIARWIAGAARELRLAAGAAAVLVPSSEVGRLLAGALCDHGLPARFMVSRDFNFDEPGVKVTTLHAAKGLEFPIVVVAHVEAGRLPRSTAATDPDEVAAFEESQRRLFYVGCTRAMRRLLVTYDRALPSPFVEGLSETRWAKVVGEMPT